MMPVTHGIVGKKNKDNSFIATASTVNIGDAANFVIVGVEGTDVFIDYGDGNEILFTLTSASFDLVSGSTVDTSNINIRVNGVVTAFNLDTGSITFTSYHITYNEDINSIASVCQNQTNLTGFSIDESTRVTSIAGAFIGTLVSELTVSIPDTSNVTNWNSAFRLCVNMTAPIELSYASAASFQNTWLGCTGIINVSAFDAPLATSLQGTWEGCTGITNFVSISSPQVTLYQDTFKDCTSAESLPMLSTSGGAIFEGMLSGMTSLICLTGLDTTNQINTIDLFLNTPALVSPDATEQTAILAGDNYVNAGSCP